MWIMANAQNGLGQSKVLRIGDLEVVGPAGHQPNGMTGTLHGLRFVGDRNPLTRSAGQRCAQMVQTKDLGRQCPPQATAGYGLNHLSPAVRPFEGIRHRRCKDAA